MNEVKEKEMRAKKIGVAIPSYYRDLFVIKRCLDSIEKQTVKPVIVAVSMSQVGYFPIKLPEYSFQLKIITTMEIKNAGENRIIAADYILNNSNVDIISFFDSDDEMVSTRLEYICRAFEEYNSDFILHNFSHIRNYMDNFVFTHTNYRCYPQILEPNPDGCGVRINTHVTIESRDITHGNISVSTTLWVNNKFNPGKEYVYWEDAEYARRLTILGYKNCYLSTQLTKYHRYQLTAEETHEVSMMQDKELNKRIFIFWTGHNTLSENRMRSIQNMHEVCGVPIILISPYNLVDWIVPGYPLHPAYEYLSLVHKADYLRCYFMHHHGGGYSDIKMQKESWLSSFEALDENKMCYGNGYTEVEGGVACIDDQQLYQEMNTNYKSLIGNGAYIFKSYTRFTEEWYNQLHSVLDQKLELLKDNPAKQPRDHLNLWLGNEYSKYPLKWTEILGNIFHPLVYKYQKQILHTLAAPSFEGYL